MKRICVFGGGRWARVLVELLRKLLPADTTIYWVTKHSFETIQSWVQQKQLEKIVILPNVDAVWIQKIDAVIVATDPQSHSFYIEQALQRRVPVLSEKPFALQHFLAQKLAELAQKTGCPVGVNFEFIYASYLQEFALVLKDLSVQTIDFFWHDPLYETRYGETKFGDVFTPIVHDSLPHCLSILKVLAPNHSALQGISLHYLSDNVTLVEAENQNFRVGFSLTRRGSARIRKISVNSGEAVLDFSEEPGEMIKASKSKKNEWKGDRPLSVSLKKFLEVVDGVKDSSQWELSIDQFVDSVSFCETAADLLKASQLRLLTSLIESQSLDLENSSHANLLMDLYLPMMAQNGQRADAHSIEKRPQLLNDALKYLKPPS